MPDTTRRGFANTWHSVSPQLRDADGIQVLAALEPFVSQDRKHDAAPVPNQATELRNTSVLDGTSDLNIAASFKVINVFSAEASVRTQMLIRESVAFEECVRSLSDPHADSNITDTRWGVGFRLVVTTTGFEANTSLNLGTVAAAVEVGGATASFEISGMGLVEPSLLAVLPKPGKFDLDANEKLNLANTELSKWVASNAQQAVKNAVPFQVRMRKPPFLTPGDDYRTILFGAMQVKKKNRIKRARQRARNRGLDASIINRTYEYFCEEQLEPNDRPNSEAANRARDWLNQAKKSA